MQFDRWAFTRWEDPVYQHVGLDSMLASRSFASGIHEIRTSEGRFHFLLRSKASKSLIVVFHGAISPKNGAQYTMPRFSGIDISSQVDSDVLLLSDATLSLAKTPIRIGWFLGDRKVDVPTITNSIVKKIIGVGGYTNVILMGGSAGGYAALRTASHIPRSTALVWNPQTDIGRYHERLVNNFASACFDCGAVDDIPVTIRSDRQFSILDRFELLVRPKVIYLQNMSDGFHRKNHAEPLLERLGCLKWSGGKVIRPVDDFIFVNGAWGKGHVTPGVDALVSVLRFILSSGSSFEELGKHIEIRIPSMFNNSPTSVV